MVLIHTTSKANASNRKLMKPLNMLANLLSAMAGPLNTTRREGESEDTACISLDTDCTYAKYGDVHEVGTTRRNSGNHALVTQQKCSVFLGAAI
jgi:hypothetical protein